MIDPLTRFGPTISREPNPQGFNLDKEAFLHLLTVKLQHQDPLNPASQEEMIGTLSQMSSLEQMTNMSTGITDLIQLSQVNFMGREATVVNSQGELEKGIIEQVVFEEGEPKFIVNGHPYTSVDIISVEIPK